MSLRTPLVLLETAAVRTPALYGLFQRKILLPAGMIERFALPELRYVFLHELAHIKRQDMAVNWLMTILQVAHWFNPLIWLAFGRAAVDRESACDELVLASGQAVEIQGYGRTIIKLLEGFVRPAPMPGLLGLLENQTQMQRRIRMIAQFKRTNRWPVFAMALLLTLGLLTLTDAQNQSEPAKLAGAGATDTGPSAPKAAASGELNNRPVSTSETGDAIDPTNGLKYVAVKTITGTNDIIEDNGATLSPNGKFLLWWGRVVPLDGSPAFQLPELQGTSITSWSPDGTKIAFHSEGIGVLPVSPKTGQATGPARQLLEENERWRLGKIYWSADSEQILFEKRNPSMVREVGSISLRDGRLNPQPEHADFGLLSPDGKTIAYSISRGGIWTKTVSSGASRIARPWRREGQFDDVITWTPDSQWVVSALDLYWREELHLARLSDGHNFDLFPPEAVGRFVGKSADGSKLYFYRSSFDTRNTSKVVPISGQPVFNVGPAVAWDYLDSHYWSADSASLAVLGDDKEGESQLWSIPLKGGKRVQFKRESLGTNALSVWALAPDFKKVLYVASAGPAQVGGKLDFYIAPISLEEGRATGPGALVFKDWQPPSSGRLGVWSPDGTRIVLPRKSDQGSELWVLFADGDMPERILQTPHKTGSAPRWSPDGHQIAVDLIAADRQLLQVVSADGGQARTILTAPKGQTVPYGWSSDSREVVAACDGTISSFPIASGSARVLVKLQEAGYEGISWLGWSPNNQRLAFYGARRGEESRLWLYSPDSRGIQELPNSHHMSWSFAWSPDSQMICAVAEEPEKIRPAGVIRELEVAAAVRKAPLVPERKPSAATTAAAATVTATPVERLEEPVFTDNFDTGASPQWRFEDLPDVGWGPGRHAVENGELLLINSRACLDVDGWTDYLVTVRVCLKEVINPEGNFAIAVRSTPSGFGSTRRDRYCLGIFGDTDARRYMWLGLNFADAANTLLHGELSRSPCSLPLDTWHILEFEVRGRHLRGFLDGKLMVEATDARLSKGGLWIGSGARALFDDFSVRRLPLTTATRTKAP